MMRKNFVEREVSAHFLRYCNAVIEGGQISFLYMKRENQEGLNLIQSVDCKALRYVKEQEKAVEVFPLDLSTIQNINFHVNRGATK